MLRTEYVTNTVLFCNISDTHGRVEKWVYDVGREKPRHMQEVDVKMYTEKQDGTLSTEHICLSTGISDVFLRTRQWTLGFHKMQGNLWLAGQLLKTLLHADIYNASKIFEFLLNILVNEKAKFWVLNRRQSTGWFKYDRDKLWLVYTQSVPVIFEPPCT
jgi:hypothetical protein